MFAEVFFLFVLVNQIQFLKLFKVFLFHKVMHGAHCTCRHSSVILLILTWIFLPFVCLPQLCACYLQAKDRTKSAYDEDNLAHSVIDLFLGGSETTSTTLHWGLLYMVAYPDIQGESEGTRMSFLYDSNQFWPFY